MGLGSRGKKICENIFRRLGMHQILSFSLFKFPLGVESELCIFLIYLSRIINYCFRRHRPINLFNHSRSCPISTPHSLFLLSLRTPITFIHRLLLCVHPHHKPSLIHARKKWVFQSLFTCDSILRIIFKHFFNKIYRFWRCMTKQI